MDLKKCEVLLTAIHLGSFTKAGAKLGYTQSGITQMMKSLEAEVGFPLFYKGHKGVSLTPEGEALLPSIRALLFSNETVNQEISFLKGLKKGTLRIGTYVSCSIRWLPDIIRRFQADYPGIVFQIMEGSGGEIARWLEDFTVDIGLTSFQKDKSYDFIHVEQDPLLAVLPEGHPFAELEKVPIELFDNQPFIIYDRVNDADIHPLLEKSGITPDIKFTGKNDYSIASMVEHGLGISIMPQLFLSLYRGNYVTRPLVPKSYRNLGIALRSARDLSPAMKLFLQYVRKNLL